MSQAEPTGTGTGPTPRGGTAGERPGAELLLAAGSAFEGLLCFEDEVHIAGELRGEVLATGRLVVEAGARIHADVVVDELVVAGELRGRAVARRRAELRSTARVDGALAAPVLRIEAGAEIHGSCRTGEDARRVAAEAGNAVDAVLDPPVFRGSGGGPADA